MLSRLKISISINICGTEDGKELVFPSFTERDVSDSTYELDAGGRVLKEEGAPKKGLSGKTIGTMPTVSEFVHDVIQALSNPESTQYTLYGAYVNITFPVRFTINKQTYNGQELVNTENKEVIIRNVYQTASLFLALHDLCPLTRELEEKYWEYSRQADNEKKNCKNPEVWRERGLKYFKLEMYALAASFFFYECHSRQSATEGKELEALIRAYLNNGIANSRAGHGAQWEIEQAFKLLNGATTEVDPLLSKKVHYWHDKFERNRKVYEDSLPIAVNCNGPRFF